MPQFWPIPWRNISTTPLTHCEPTRTRVGIALRAPSNFPDARSAFMGSVGRKHLFAIWQCEQWAEKDCAPATIGFIVGVPHNVTRSFRHDVSVDRRRQPSKTVLARRTEQAVAAMAATRERSRFRQARRHIARHQVAGGSRQRNRVPRAEVAPAFGPRVF